MQHLQCEFSLETKAAQDQDEPMFKFAGYASTFKNTDLVNDVIEEGAFKESLSRKNGKKIKILWQHDTSMPIGKVTSIKEDEKGLFIKAELPKAHTQAADVITLMEGGIIDAMSIGFTVDDQEFIGKSGKRQLKAVTVHEISLVTFPANPKAKVTSFKELPEFKELPLGARNTVWDQEEAEERVAQFTLSNNNYKHAFLCPVPGDYNEMDIQSFDCRLPFADVIDNQLKGVPAAIFRAAALFKGGLETEVPAGNIAVVKKTIVIYYQKMGLPDPFESTKFHAEELDVLTKRELEQILRDSGLSLSKSAATKFVSCLDWHRSESDDHNDSQQVMSFIHSSILNMTENIKNGN